MESLNIFKKKINFVTGLNIDKYGNFQLLELKKINNSHCPVFSYIGNIKNFAQNGFFNKRTFVEQFKNLRTKVNSDNILINSFKNKELENEVVNSLKISGFLNISVKEKNIEGIILDSKITEKEMSVYFDEDSVTFITIENSVIIEKERLLLSEFKVSSVAKLTKNLKKDYVFVFGINSELLESVKQIFYNLNIEVRSENIWKNFLSFSDAIPNILSAESGAFIEVLSLTVPDIKKWSIKPNTNGLTTKKIKKTKSILKKNMTFLPKPKKMSNKEKKYLPKKDIQKKLPKEKINFLPKNKKKKSVKNSAGFISNKHIAVFLPKPKKKTSWEKFINILKSEI